MSANTQFLPPGLLALMLDNRTASRVVDLTEEFRANAAECQELANRWAGEGKRQYEELAREWLELAERLEDRRRSAGASAVLAHG
jgi:hypothetical protein